MSTTIEQLEKDLESIDFEINKLKIEKDEYIPEFYTKKLAKLESKYDELEAQIDKLGSEIVESLDTSQSSLVNKLFKDGDIIRREVDFRTCSEKLDANKLAFILMNKDKLPTRSLKEEKDWSILEKDYHMLNIDANNIGTLVVKHFRANDVAMRIQSCGSIGGQSMLREARHVVYEPHYVDVDMENAHPTFTIWLCNMFGIKCDNLSLYTSMRESILKDIADLNSVSRGDAKQLVLSIMYGSQTTKWKRDNSTIKDTKFLKLFRREIANIQKTIASKFDVFKKKVVANRIAKGKDYNHDGATMSNLNQHIEDYLLSLMMDEVDKEHVDKCINCFDGAMLPKEIDANGVVERTNAKFKSLGIDVKVKIKPFDEGFDLKSIGFDKRVNYVKQYPQKKDTKVENVEHPNRFDLDDDYYWSDFLHEFSSTEFDYTVDLKKFMVANLPRVFVFVGKGVVIKLSEENPYDECNLKSLSISTDIAIVGDSKNPISLACAITMVKSQLRQFTRTTCEYDPSYSNQKVFYTTYPYKAHLLDRQVAENEVQFFVDYIRELICNNHDASFVQAMKWLNWSVRHPGKKSGKCLVIQGEPGAGKSSLGTYLSEYIFGLHNSNPNVNGLDALLKDNNSMLEHKRLVCVNETSTEAKYYVSSADKFKSMITEKNCSIKALYKDVKASINDWEFILTSNHLTCVRIEKGDRRFITLKVSDKRVSDNEYWDTFHSTLEDPEYVDKVYTYLYNLHSDTSLRTEMPVQTELRDQVMAMSLSSTEMFVQWFTSDESNRGHTYKFSEMLSKYKFWCEEMGEVSKSGRILGVALTSSGLFRKWDSHGPMYQLL